jgi:hypothetical protein
MTRRQRGDAAARAQPFERRRASHHDGDPYDGRRSRACCRGQSDSGPAGRSKGVSTSGKLRLVTAHLTVGTRGSARLERPRHARPAGAAWAAGTDRSSGCTRRSGAGPDRKALGQPRASGGTSATRMFKRARPTRPGRRTSSPDEEAQHLRRELHLLLHRGCGTRKRGGGGAKYARMACPRSRFKERQLCPPRPRLSAAPLRARPARARWCSETMTDTAGVTAESRGLLRHVHQRGKRSI